MDTYENNDLSGEQIEQTEPNMPPMEHEVPQQPEPQAQAQPETVYGAQTGRKESPFANSPYVSAAPNWQSNPGYGYQQPNNGYGYQQNYGYQQPNYTYQKPASTAPESKPEKKSGGKVWTAIAIGCMVVALAIGFIQNASLKKQVKDLQEQNKLVSQSYDEKLNVLREEIETNSNVGSGESVSGTPNATVDGSLTPAQVYAQSVNSVVAISSTTVVNNFGQTTEGVSSGSGFVLTEDGYIVSNYHVVEGATKLAVITCDGTEYEAEYIGGDESNDIALLKVEATGLQAATVGSSDALIVGDQVAAIGNPLGELASTMTVGYISAKDRVVTTDGTQINMMQTDAAINPGNSGGPLFNMKGEVVGITTAKYSGTTSSGASIEGIGFAIPIDDVIGMLEDLKEYGYVTGAYLGVNVRNVDDTVAASYGLPMGALVVEVIEGSSAQTAGIRAQDIIVNLGGYDVENLNDLTRALRKFEAGDTITVTVYRYGSGESQLSITLDEKPQASEQETEPTVDPTVGSDLPTNGGAQDWFDYFFGN